MNEGAFGIPPAWDIAGKWSGAPPLRPFRDRYPELEAMLQRTRGAAAPSPAMPEPIPSAAPLLAALLPYAPEPIPSAEPSPSGLLPPVEPSASVSAAPSHSVLLPAAPAPAEPAVCNLCNRFTTGEQRLALPGAQYPTGASKAIITKIKDQPYVRKTLTDRLGKSLLLAQTAEGAGYINGMAVGSFLTEISVGTHIQAVASQEQTLTRITHFCCVPGETEMEQRTPLIYAFLMSYGGVPMLRDAPPIYKSAAEFALIAARLMRGLALLHSQLIVHADMHSGNVLVKDDALSPMIIDYGYSVVAQHPLTGWDARLLWEHHWQTPEFHTTYVANIARRDTEEAKIDATRRLSALLVDPSFDVFRAAIILLIFSGSMMYAKSSAPTKTAYDTFHEAWKWDRKLTDVDRQHAVLFPPDFAATVARFAREDQGYGRVVAVLQKCISSLPISRPTAAVAAAELYGLASQLSGAAITEEMPVLRFAFDFGLTYDTLTPVQTHVFNGVMSRLIEQLPEQVSEGPAGALILAVGDGARFTAKLAAATEGATDTDNWIQQQVDAILPSVVHTVWLVHQLTQRPHYQRMQFPGNLQDEQKMLDDRILFVMRHLDGQAIAPSFGSLLLYAMAAGHAQFEPGEIHYKPVLHSLFPLGPEDPNYLEESGALDVPLDKLPQYQESFEYFIGEDPGLQETMLKAALRLLTQYRGIRMLDTTVRQYVDGVRAKISGGDKIAKLKFNSPPSRFDHHEPLYVAVYKLITGERGRPALHTPPVV